MAHQDTFQHLLLLVLILAGLVVIFIIQNVAIVDVQFFTWSVSIPRSLLIFIVLGVGIMMGWFFKSFTKLQKKSE